MLTAPPRSSRSTRLAVYLADVAALLCVAALLLHFQNGGRPTPSEQWTGEIRQASALVAANFATYVRTEFGTPGQGGRNDYRPPAAVAKIKDTIHAAIPVVREASEYAAVRALLRQLGGAPALLGELEALGFVSEGRLTTGTKPLNVFARVAAGVVTQPGMEAEQANLGAHGQRFMIACNLPENEEHWSSTAPEWVRNLSWSLFNVAVLGLGNAQQLRAAVEMVEAMEVAALLYASKTPAWSTGLGMYFHVYGHASVNALHLHLVDLNATGPTFEALRYKNLPLQAVLHVLRKELHGG